MVSQCCCCGNNFHVESDEVLFCSSKCEKEHDLFSVEKEGKSLAAPVNNSYFTPEEFPLQKLNKKIARRSNARQKKKFNLNTLIIP